MGPQGLKTVGGMAGVSFKSFERLAITMADGLQQRQALLLVGLLLGSSMLVMLDFSSQNQEITEELYSPSAQFAGAGDGMDLTLSTSPNYNLELDLMDKQPLINAELHLAPKILPTQSGFVWDEQADWTHSDALMNGSVVSNDALTGTSAGVLWDFNNNNQGWTFLNSYAGRVTSPACGYNGSAGGSLRTYAGSTYATSPTVNLAGGVNIPFHAWVNEGTTSCGETPDSNENLYFQYKTSAGGWTNFQTFTGGNLQPQGVTSNFQFMTILPAAALHANSQFRIHQNSGSGTCCDYWFVDDVHIATPPESNWTSPSMGHKNGVSQPLPSESYAPVTIEATVPQGAFLNWSVLDGAGNLIPGMHGSNTFIVPLNVIDVAVHDEIRLHLEFKSGGTAMPLVHSISGDGAASESFNTEPTQRGWNLSGSTYSIPLQSVSGGVNETMTSPWFWANAPVYDAEVFGDVDNAQVQIRHSPDEPWANVTLPHAPLLDAPIYGLQMNVVALPPADGNMSNFTSWNVKELNHEMFGGQYPARPGLDFNLDGRYEWGGADARVGSWGWQDRFTNGENHVDLTLSSSAPTTASVWVPHTDLESFSFAFHANSGSVQEIAIFAQNDLVVNRSYTMATAEHVSLNITEFSELKEKIAAIPNTVRFTGTEFTEIRIEVSGQGDVTLGGLSAPYNASHLVTAGADSAFVMGVNEARAFVTAIGGVQSVPLPFLAAERGGLAVEILDLQTSATVQLQDGSMVDPELVLTPSQRWETIETEYQLIGGTITHHRFDVYSMNHQATWMFPTDGSSPYGLGDAELVELHPDFPIVVTETSTTNAANITFRLRPDWDDEMQLTATSRVVLQNGVISIPFAHTWGSISQQGYENDLEIKSLVFSEDEGIMPPERQYLRGGELMNISVRIGFEDILGQHGFVDDDARLTLYRNGLEVLNTTTLTGTYWNFTDTIPFTYGDVTWTFQLESLNGSTVVDPAEQSRTFTVDSVKPRVMSSTVERYDHRTPSPTQVFQVTVTDQPVLPEDIEAMVWMEWIDDDNLNGWPDEGEFNPIPLLLPSDLTQLTGVYTLMIDDSAGSLGQKVAVYLEGTDPSGYALKDGGGPEEGEQLFVYQLAIDGAPTLEPDAFTWQDGRKSWIHPAQPYELDVKISEPNGGSDLATVDVMLAHNQGSDSMTITWDFETGNCTTESIHLILEDCEMMGENGTAGPFEKDMMLNIQLHFGWNTPDLGENRREPAIRVVDRAGQEQMKTFPQHRWRFSAGLSIPEESINLFLTSGSFLGDGARVTPLTPMEISGGLVFSETSTVPDFDCQVDVLFAGQTHSADAINGIWSIPLEAPVVSGSLPLTWSVGCLEGQGVDLSDKETAVKWILVDGTGPEPVEVLSPRPRAILAGESHEVRVVLKEIGGLDTQSLELVWQVEDFETGDIIRSGREPLVLDGGEIAGLRLEVVTEMNLSEINQEMLKDRLVVQIRVEGRDLAGNAVLGLGGTTSGAPITTWNMDWLQPNFEMEPSAITYSRLLLEVGETTSVQLEVQNSGTLDGDVEVTFSSIEMDGTRSLIQRKTVSVPAGAIAVVSLDWGPENSGMQWVEASLENGEIASGPTIDVRNPEQLAFSEQVFGDVHPLIGTIASLLFLSIIATVLIWMKRLTLNQGAKIDYDWDDYSSELEGDDDYEDEDDDDIEEGMDAQEASTATTSVPEPQAQTGDVTTDWVKGDDGYWYYHDKASNEWWYKDAEGNIVKHS